MDWCLARLRLRFWLLWRERPRWRAHCAPICVCKVSAANEHARSPAAIGRAEQRSGDRIRAGACLSEASLRPTPGGVSSARHPAGAGPLARLSFAYLFFGEAKKSKARGRRKPCGRSNTEGYWLAFSSATFFWRSKKVSSSAYKAETGIQNSRSQKRA